MYLFWWMWCARDNDLLGDRWGHRLLTTFSSSLIRQAPNQRGAPYCNHSPPFFHYIIIILIYHSRSNHFNWLKVWIKKVMRKNWWELFLASYLRHLWHSVIGNAGGWRLKNSEPLGANTGWKLNSKTSQWRVERENSDSKNYELWYFTYKLIKIHELHTFINTDFDHI